MFKTMTTIPILAGLILAFGRIPTVDGTTYGKVAMAGVCTVDALGLIWIKNMLIDKVSEK